MFWGLSGHKIYTKKVKADFAIQKDLNVKADKEGFEHVAVCDA